MKLKIIMKNNNEWNNEENKWNNNNNEKWK